MMRIDILSVMPEALDSPLHCSILQRAQDKGLVEIHVHNLRDWSLRKHRKVDDYPFGGEAGMVMQIEPVYRCIEALKQERDYDEVIFTSPDGEQLSQPMANTLSLAQNLIILCGHYKGVDYRIREHLVTREISIGDYVLTGGELPAAERLLPRRPARGARLHTTGRVQRLDGARGATERQRGQDRRLEDAAGPGAHPTSQARPAEVNTRIKYCEKRAYLIF